MLQLNGTMFTIATYAEVQGKKEYKMASFPKSHQYTLLKSHHYDVAQFAPRMPRSCLNEYLLLSFDFLQFQMEKKREYGRWTPENMEAAIKEFGEGKIRLNQIVTKYEIPKKTFLRHYRGEVVRGYRRYPHSSVNGRETALPPEAEQELEEVILSFESSLMGLTRTEVRKLAYNILEANPHIKNPFNHESKMAGTKWYYSFMKRHPHLSLRQPENVSVARVKGFNKQNVMHFFDALQKIVDDNELNALRIYNVDESGISTVQKKSPKIIGEKGKPRIGQLATGERGVNTTAVCCCSASGQFVPPMLIFKRMRNCIDLKTGAPEGSLVEVSETGYINSDLFIKWLRHFIKFVKPSAEEKVLLVLDGHSTHSKNLEAINLAKENGVIILQLPGHTTHRLQPLDVAVFKPLQLYYDEAVVKHLRKEDRVTQFSVAGLFAEAYARAASMSNAIAGFKSTGIWPLDRNVFRDTDFVTTNVFRAESDPMEGTTDAFQEPSTSGVTLPMTMTDSQESEDAEPDRNARNLLVSVKQISPLPEVTVKQGKRLSKGAQKAEVLTSTPYKRQLEERREATTKKLEKFKRKLSASFETSETQNNIKPERKSRKKVCQNKVGSQKNVESWFCFICGEDRKEDMVQCQKCRKWAHEECVGNYKKDIVFFCGTC